MTIHEFGKENEKVILLIHPSVVKWDYFEYVIPLLEKAYRLIVPALPGYDFDEKSDFTSVEQIDTVFGKYPDLGHAGLVLLKPELFAEKIRRL